MNYLVNKKDILSISTVLLIQEVLRVTALNLNNRVVKSPIKNSCSNVQIQRRRHVYYLIYYIGLYSSNMLCLCRSNCSHAVQLRNYTSSLFTKEVMDLCMWFRALHDMNFVLFITRESVHRVQKVALQSRQTQSNWKIMMGEGCVCVCFYNRNEKLISGMEWESFQLQERRDFGVGSRVRLLLCGWMRGLDAPSSRVARSRQLSKHLSG